MSLFLVLLAYIHNPADWQHYPKLVEIRNFTADAFNTVYITTPNSIIKLNDESLLPERTYGPGEGLPPNIHYAIFDNDLQKFWIATGDGGLYLFTPLAGTTRKLPVGSTTEAQGIGVGSEYVFLNYGSSIKAVDKYSEQTTDAEPGSDVQWTAAPDQYTLRNSYPFLAPWYLVDDEFNQLTFSQVFTHRNKVFVSVPAYGYMVFDGLSWRELVRFRSPRVSGVHSMFSSDSSLYVIGKEGVDQLIPAQGLLVSHSYSRWGTTVNPAPSWSNGAYDELRRTNYQKVRLIGDNLFLLDKREADVLNIPSKKLSEITGTRWLYDIDYNKDSLFLATDKGVFLTLIPDTEPEPLADERSKLVADDVLGIIRGDLARYFWTGRMVVKQASEGWEYFVSPAFIPVPQEAIAGRDSLVVLGGTGGVTVYNPETYFQERLTTEEGLLSDTVTALYVQDNFLWIATDAGLSRFDLNAALP
ncbi:hypothetical protein JXM67_01075 [candidate division WOR-3 bacterium]|nr:hypothetical protein [candidate division WOR-3 bacterium]